MPILQDGGDVRAGADVEAGHQFGHLIQEEAGGDDRRRGFENDAAAHGNEPRAGVVGWSDGGMIVQRGAGYNRKKTL